RNFKARVDQNDIGHRPASTERAINNTPDALPCHSRVSVSASTTFPARTLSHLDIVGLADASGAMHPKNVTGVRIGGTLPSAVASMSGCFWGKPCHPIAGGRVTALERRAEVRRKV